jgi:putative ABC transport system permease protein
MRNSSLKLALRVLARRKVFTAISLVGIVLTLSVLVVATAVLDNTFAAVRPESRLDRMLFVRKVGRYGPHNSQTSGPGYGFLARMVHNLPGVEGVTIYEENRTAVIFEGGRRIEADLKQADGEYWRILDFQFLEGGPFSPEDDAADRSVIVISEPMRRQLFGDAPALGRPVNIAGRIYHVKGVVPPVTITRLSSYAEIWAPIGVINSEERSAFLGHFSAIVLARSRDDVAFMQSVFASRVKNYPIDDPKTYTEVRSGLDTAFESFAREMTANGRIGGGTFGVRAAGIVGALLFMLLPSLNLITLNLSRIMERSSEIGVRKAFGAPRLALVTQFVVENIVLTVIGGVIGFIVALGLLHAVDVSGLLPDVQLHLNVRVFGYGLLLAVFFGLFSGAYPAWKMSRLDAVNALRGGAL